MQTLQLIIVEFSKYQQFAAQPMTQLTVKEK